MVGVCGLIEDERRRDYSTHSADHRYDFSILSWETKGFKLSYRAPVLFGNY
uniref:Uncharacterized protein n=1 Tax=Helianthus annuus TaxID=4232 RepID=A0A251TJY2_HELAN